MAFHAATELGLLCAAWAVMLEGVLDAAYLVDASTLRILAANTEAGRLWGVTPRDLVGRPVADLSATPEDHAFWSDAACGEDSNITSETIVVRFDGTVLPVLRRVSRLTAKDAGVAGTFVVHVQDRSRQRATEDELETRLAELRATLESTADGILVTDLRGAIQGFNRRFAALWGLPESLLIEKNDAAVWAWMRRSVADPQDDARRMEVIQEATLMQSTDVLRLHSGKVVERVTLPQSSRGQPIGRVYSFRDITERVASRERIEELAHTDALTGLPNRQLLADRVEFSAALSQRNGHPFALMVANLDRFKYINDTFGLGFGDRVLLEAAERLKGCLRNIDTVSRLGSDEFVLLVHQADAHGAEATARRVIEAMQRSFSIDATEFTVTCSIGVALCPIDGNNLDTLMRGAHAAMKRVKELGRASFRFHQAQSQPVARSQMQLDHAMRQALVSGYFRLHYQPQIELKTGAVVGAEALIRWGDPVLGEVSPGEFIPVAEQSGFIIAIGDWVLAQAVKQAAAWAAQGAPIPVAINVSALQFQQVDFVDRVSAELEAAGLAPHLLELELTESILLHDADDALQRLQALAQLGVLMSIDDFGTGYSSLGYLKRFPIARLKIDRSFIRPLPGESSDLAIVNAIIQLGRALKLKVIAEGVETEPQRQCLLDAGCDEFQGFLFAPALDAQAFEARTGRGAMPAPVVRLISG